MLITKEIYINPIDLSNLGENLGKYPIKGNAEKPNTLYGVPAYHSCLVDIGEILVVYEDSDTHQRITRLIKIEKLPVMLQ
jgi:hypothetical protein